MTLQRVNCHRSERQCKSPVVSVFMPVYCREEYLPKALDSIIAQTFSDFELIVSVDASPDRTLQIARTYAERDARIKVLCLPHDGEVAARNSAVRNANPVSKYLMNHDSDDVSLPNKLLRLVTYLERHPEIAIVGCSAEYFDDAGSYLGKPVIEYEPSRIRQTFGQTNSMINSASLIRREVYSRIGLYRRLLEDAGCDDYDFFARALVAGFELANIQEVLHRIRLHPRALGILRARRDAIVVRAIGEAYRAGHVATQMESAFALGIDQNAGMGKEMTPDEDSPHC